MKKVFSLLIIFAVNLPVAIAYDPKGVWDVGQDSLVRCYLEDPSNQGYGRPSSGPISVEYCKKRIHGVWGVGETGKVGCFLEDKSNSGHRRVKSSPIDEKHCGKLKGDWEIDHAGKVRCYIDSDDLAGSQPIDEKYCKKKIRGVWDVGGQGKMGCFMEDLSNPGFGIPKTQSIDEKFCKNNRRQSNVGREIVIEKDQSSNKKEDVASSSKQ